MATSGDCSSWAARRHNASLGMIRLVMTPMFFAVWLAAAVVKKDPICSIQPPINAMPYKPNTNTPFARVDRLAPPNNDMLRRTRSFNQINQCAEWVGSDISGTDINHRHYTAAHQEHVQEDHTGKTQPFSKDDFPAADRFGDQGVDRSGADLAGKRIDRCQHGHDRGQKIDHVHARHQHEIAHLIQHDKLVIT